MFPVKHGEVSQGAAGATQSEASGERRTKRAPVTFEEVAAAADAIAQAGEKITIERVRQMVGGGGNQAVMGHLGKWRELRRKGAQFGGLSAGGLMSDGLKAALALAIDEEIKCQKQSAEESIREQLEELMEGHKALESDLRIATSAAFEQEADIEKMSGVMAELEKRMETERQEAALARENFLGQVKALDGQNRELRQELARRHEAAIEARGKDVAQVTQIESLTGELKSLRASLDAAQSRVSATEQKAAVAQAQLTGKDDLVQVLQGQLQEAQERCRSLSEDVSRTRGRADAAESAQEALRRELDEARQHRRGSRDDDRGPGAPAALHRRGGEAGGGHGPDGWAPSPVPASSFRGSATGAGLTPPAPASPKSEAAVQHEGSQVGSPTRPLSPQARERAIEAALQPALDPKIRQQLGKVTSREEQKRQKDMLVTAARLRGADLRRGSDLLPQDDLTGLPASEPRYREQTGPNPRSKP